jgi:hypothetical protein
MPKFMPKFYRKKPVVIQAKQWTGDNLTEMLGFCERCFSKGEANNLVVVTLEGDMTAAVGDYIIRGVKGEFYPIKELIFKQTYESVV